MILAVGAAACGDDVTVKETTPVTPTPVVRSVVVSPASATIAPSGSFTFGAAVDADAGLARTVTWSSSNTNVAAVSNTGVATATAAVGGGVTSICATSTADTDVKGCAQLTVAPQVAATVAIAAVTRDCDPINLAVFGAVCGLNQSVVANNVVGQITVQATVNRPAGSGTQQVVFQVLDAAGTTVLKSYTQTVTANTLANSEDLAAQTVLNNTVSQPINTAEYDLTPPANVGPARPFFGNGAHVIRVCISGTVDSCASAPQSALALRSFTFNNPNGFHVTITNNISTGNNAAGAAVRQFAANGLAWSGGVGLSLQASPVNYVSPGTNVTANAVATTLTFGQGCDLALGNRAVAATVSASGVMTGTLAYTNQTAASAGSVNSYEMTPGCAVNNGAGEIPGATAEVNGQPFINYPLGGVFGANNILNNPFTPVVPALGTATAVRLDNRAPQGTIVVNANPNGRANGWINDAVVFDALQPVAGAATSNNMIANTSTAADAGFGGLAFKAKVNTTLALALADVDRSSPTSPAPSLAATLTNANYCLVQFAVDAFLNRTANPGACATTMGLDRAPPVATYDATSLAANARLSAATIGGEFVIALNDTGLVGNSGMNPGTPLLGSVQRRNIVADPTCLLGSTAATKCATQAAMGGAPPLMTTAGTGAALTAVAGTAGASDVDHGYYVFNGTAKDAAGNTTVVPQRAIVYDMSAPIISNTSAPATVAAAGYSASSFISEDVDIQNYWFSVAYAGAPAALTPALVGQAPTVVSAFNPTTLVNTNFAVTNTVTLPLAIQANMAAGLTNQSGVSTTSRNQANVQATSAAAVPTVTTPTAITIPASWTAYGAPTAPAGVTGITAGVSAGTAAAPTSTTISITATGATAIFNQPFTRVDFYAVDQSGTQFIFIGSASAATLNDNGAVRTFTYSATITGSAIGPTLFGPTPPAAGASYASSIVGLGFGASGNVAMISSAALAFNIRN
ncbi:MAG TPA: hypothetical protein VE967_05490 [Gemmatimonadaceae bacterium]|nr:hypothetical protein [Gemmatimonadaceae bacterium]